MKSSFRRYGAVRALCLATIVTSCGAPADPALVDEDVDESQQGLPKPRGNNGARDYCNNPSALCLPAEGDCDADSQCLDGSICAANVGPQFLFPVGWDVCAPAHCANEQLDGDETAVDCGGSCSVPEFDCDSRCERLPAGDRNFCSKMCPCGQGEGDCDSSAACEAGLSCGSNNGPNFALPPGYDVCVPTHCTDRRQNGDETRPDCGGSCGVCPAIQCETEPSTHRCTSECACDLGEGDCDATDQCAPGLACVTDNGPAFGLPAEWDVCGPLHCVNGQLDSNQGETGADCGGVCRPCAKIATFTLSIGEGSARVSNSSGGGDVYCQGNELTLTTCQWNFPLGSEVAVDSPAISPYSSATWTGFDECSYYGRSARCFALLNTSRTASLVWTRWDLD